jgi:archaellum component FlaC
VSSVSIVVDLQGIDLGAIDTARAKITEAVNDEQVRKLLTGDVAGTALAGFGSAVAALKTTPNAEALLAPITAAAKSLLAKVTPGSLPIAEYTAAIRDGAGIVKKIVDVLQSDPKALAELLPIDRVTVLAKAMTAGYSISGVDEVARLRSLIVRFEGGLSVEPAELAKLAVEALLPFGGVLELRGGINAILSAAVAIHLPPRRIEDLVLALDAVAAAAADPQKLAVALQKLATARRFTLDLIIKDLVAIRRAVEALDVAASLAPLLALAEKIRTGERGFLEMLDAIREQVQVARVDLEQFDPADVKPFIDEVLARIEAWARLNIEQPVDEQVAAAQTFVRGLFTELPLRSMRDQVSRFLAGIATAINDADLDAVAGQIKARIAEIGDAIADPQALAGEVQEVLADVRTAIEGVVAKVEGALGEVKARIEEVQVKLKEVLDRVVQVLHDFKALMDQLTAQIDNLGIESAVEQVVTAIRELRAQAEAILSAAELPAPLRPLVGQVIDALEGIDLEGLFGPVRDALAQVQIPPQVNAQINDALGQVAEKLEKAIPASLIAAIEGEIGTLLETIRQFDPKKLEAALQAYVADASAFLKNLDVTGAVTQIRGPFQTLLDAIDAVHPRKLLAPAIEAYDSLLGGLKPPAAEERDSFSTILDEAGAAATKELLAPVAQFTGAQPAVTTSANAATPPATAPEPQLADVRPGDLVRLFAWLPNKLREALQALPATVAGEALQTIDGFTAGLARDLRRLRVSIGDIEARIQEQLDEQLSLVGAAQMRAQLAIQVSAPGVDVDVSLSALATVSTGDLAAEIETSLNDIRGEAREAAAAIAGNSAVILERAADALESFRLAGAVATIDDLLAELDPEPLAAEIDAFAVAVLKKVQEVMPTLAADLEAAIRRLRELFQELNPVAQARKFFRVLDVIREELAILSPARLADELGDIHAAIRAAVAAYDPAELAKPIAEALQKIAGSIANLSVADLLGDVDFLEPIVKQIEAISPAAFLEDVGKQLKAVGEELQKLDPGALLDSVNQIVPRVEEGFEKAVEAIRAELIALLESLRYAADNASFSLEVSIG